MARKQKIKKSSDTPETVMPVAEPPEGEVVARYQIRQTSYRFRGRFYKIGSTITPDDASFSWAEKRGYLVPEGGTHA